MSSLRFEEITLISSDFGEENPMPDFKNTSYIHATYETTSRLTDEDKKYLGRGMIGSLLPYLSQDGYGDELRPRKFKAAILENECLRAEFLPELGGRLWSLYHKGLKRELLYKNGIVKPCNLALRDAWVAGGVEWNACIKGHSPFTSSPLFTAEGKNDSGEPILTMYEYERIRGIVFGINAYLSGDKLYIRTTLENRGDSEAYTYWWSNIAVRESGVRVLADADEMFSCTYGDNHYIIDKIKAPIFDVVDISYPERAERAGDVFFVIPDEKKKWIAALDSDGIGLLQYSTSELKGRKVFFWGSGDGGRNWNRHLTGSSEGYIEIQAGLLRTQMEHIPIPANTAWCFTECYTALSLPKSILEKDFGSASAAISEQLDWALDPALANIPLKANRNIKMMGSGWGAIEGDGISEYYDFPKESIGDIEMEWELLFERGYLEFKDGKNSPRSYYISDKALSLLERSLSGKEGDHWYTYLHIGVIKYVRSDINGAIEAFKKSLEKLNTPWAYRNLAMIYKNDLENGEAALSYIEKAISLTSLDCRGLMIDAAKILIDLEKYDRWIELFSYLTEPLAKNGRLRLYLAIAYMRTSKIAEAKSILNESFTMSNIKEGELAISAVWEELYGEEKPLPKNLNFKMNEKKKLRGGKMK